jgi:hypothetical protein
MRDALRGGAAQSSQMLPGVIGGYGGGTFNMDGTQVTPAGGADVGVLPSPSLSAMQRGTQSDKADAGYSIREASPSMNTIADETGPVEPSPAMPQPQPLGGSLRQGFDYDAAMRAMVGEKPKNNTVAMILAAIGDGLASYNGQQPWAMRSILQQRQGYQDRLVQAAQALAGWRYRDFARQNEADLNASAPFTIGRDRVQFNPATGKSEVLYNGPEDSELYASQLGLEPGTEPYFRAVEDYVLRSSGPSAHSRDKELDDYRTGNDARMEDLRFGNRRKIEGLRQGNRLEAIRTRPAPVGRSGGRAGAGQGGDGLPVVSSPAEAARLPKGTRFRTLDGRVKMVP